MKNLHLVAFALLVVAGLNWMVFVIWGTDLATWLFGDMGSAGAQILYVLLGLAAIYELVSHKKNCKTC